VTTTADAHTAFVEDGGGAIRELFERLQAAVGDRYRIEREVGRGGAAYVVHARDLHHDRDVAIKVWRPDFAISPERFLREVLIVAKLQHPNIVPLFDSGRIDDIPYYVMPLVEGESLRQRIEKTRVLPLAEALALAREVASALAYAHSRGLLHRDVKPENILLSEGHAMLSDFGIARAIEQSMDSASTASGVVLGTPAYMSPEQAFGDREVDQRSDQYSLACVVYEMLSGVAPHGSGAPFTVLRRVVATPAPDLRASRPDVPPSVAAAIARALSPEPEGRFESVAAFARALDAGDGVGREPLGLPRGRLATRFARAVPAGPARKVIAAGAVLALVGGGLAIARVSGGLGDWKHGTDDLDPRRIAVLYFDDHSADRSLGYLASGLTESLIHELSGVGPMQVISRNGVKPFRDHPVPMDSIARALRVGSVVEGSVQRSGNRIRVTVQLIDARDGTHLGSSELERQMGELFLLEDDLARRVSAELRRRIGVEVRLREQTAATRNTDARTLVWRANRLRDEADQMATSRDTTGLRGAVALGRSADSLLAEAERADGKWIEPVLDRGWVALELAGRQSGAPRNAAFVTGMAHADRALRRDSANASALELRGTLRYYLAERTVLDRRTVALYLSEAEGDLRRAVARDSTLASAWGTLSSVRRAAGDMADAERLAMIALAQDAYLKDAPSILQALFAAALMNDSLDAASRWCERGAADFPNDVGFVTCRLTLVAEDMRGPPNVKLATTLLAEARRLDPEERAVARGSPWLPIYREMLGAVVLARTGARDSARAVAARARRSVGDDAVMRVDLTYEEALLELVLGNRANAIRLLSAYLDERPYLRELVGRHPRWKALWTDPAFQSLVRTVRSRE
jgi:eukaryotic-like serine/threonine-protein kinase